VINGASVVDKRVGWPQVLLEFVARDHFAGLRQQHREHLERLRCVARPLVQVR